MLRSFVFLALVAVSAAASVFHVNDKGTYKIPSAKAAANKCQSIGMKLATRQQLEAAWKGGLDMCACGWLTDGSAAYPIQKPRKGCGTNKAGIRNCGRKPWDGQVGFDAYCYGVKKLPAPTPAKPTEEAETLFFGYESLVLLGASAKAADVPVTSKGTSIVEGPKGMKAWQFQGKPDSFVKIANDGSLNLAGKSWTVGTFFYQEGSIRNGPILEWRGRGPFGTHFWIWGNTLFTNLDAYTGKSAAYHWQAPKVNAWRFVGASYNATSGDFYMWDDDKVFHKNPGKLGPLDQVGDVYIGIRPASPKFNPLKAKLAGMMLLKGAIKPSQIAEFRDHLVLVAKAEAPAADAPTKKPAVTYSERNGDCVGHDIKQIKKTKLDVCKKECNAIAACKTLLFVDHGANSYCWLKKYECPKLTATNHNEYHFFNKKA